MAAAAAAITVFVLMGLYRIGMHIPSRLTRRLTVVLPLTDQDNLPRVRQALLARSETILDLECARDVRARTETLTFHLTIPGGKPLSDLFGLDKDVPEVLRFSIA